MSDSRNPIPWVDLPDIEFVSLIRKNSTSQLWEANELSLSRSVTIKIFDVSHFGSRDFDDVWLEQIFGQAGYPVEVCPRVHQYGRVDNFCFQITDSIQGQTLQELLHEGISAISFRNVIIRAALALQELHAQTIYHRDLRPENILVDQAEDVFLIGLGSDFRSSDPKIESLYLPTSHYMSPEFKLAYRASPQSDLFSLAAVVYQALTGEVPATEGSVDDSSAQVTLFNVLRLPEKFKGYRTVLEQALQTTPGDRHSSAIEFANDLMSIESEDIEHEVQIKTQPISSEEVRLAGANLFDLDGEAVRGIAVTSVGSNSKVLRWLASLGVGMLLLSLLWMFTLRSDLLPDPIVGFLESKDDSEIEFARNQAQSLREDPNQGLSTVLAAYNRLLSLTPNDPVVLKALEDIGSEWFSSIEEALDQGNYTFAETRLDEAESVFPQEPRLNALSIRIQNWKRAESLFEASRSQRLGFIEDEVPVLNSLIVSYQNVLRLAPAHDGAVAELKAIAVQFSQLAKEAFAVRDLTGAVNFLERAQAADASIQALEDVRELLSQTEELRVTIENILDEARSYRALGQLIAPSGENAAELYNRVLVVEPKNDIAIQAIGELTVSILADAERLFELGDLLAADDLLIQALMAGIEEGSLSDLRKQISQEQEKINQITEYLAKARALMGQGYITMPINENAVAELRSIQSIDPNNEEARALLEKCAELLANVAKDAYSYGFAEEAFDYLDLAIAIDPKQISWSLLRAEWSKKPLDSNIKRSL